MGASSWRYYTPYRSDPETALQELRHRVFEAGEYSMGFGGFAPQDANASQLDRLLSVADTLGPMGESIRRLVSAVKAGDFSGLSAQERTQAEQMKASMDMLAGLKGGFGSTPDEKPETIEELLEMVAEDGTHSILDIERTSARKEFGAAIPLPDRDVQRYFGTERPDHNQVEARWADVSERLERWEAYYVTVYKDGEPHEYAFIGCSGD